MLGSLAPDHFITQKRRLTALSCKNQPLSQSSHLKAVWPLVNFHILTGNLISTLQIFACDFTMLFIVFGAKDKQQPHKKRKTTQQDVLKKIDDSLKSFMEYQQQADRLCLEAERERERKEEERERRSEGKRTRSSS